MRPTTTTHKHPCSASATTSLLYATLLTAALLLIYSIIPDARFSSITKHHHISAPPTTDQLLIPQTNVSHLLFGIAASAATWTERSEYASLWWRSGVTRGYVWLDAEPDHSDNVSLHSHIAPIPPYKISDPKSQSAVRIARILLQSFELGLPDVRWFVMGDDDTVFFPENLATVLGKYDHREMYYVGGNSETVVQDELHSYDMAFGGGGYAISYRLAEELVQILDSCLDRFFYFDESDQRIWACISELGVSLTKEPGFHQLDVRASPYGLLAAHPMALLVSLHHLDAVESMFPLPKSQTDSIKSIVQAYRVDPGRILQRTICYDHSLKWTLSVSWGYTVQVWPKVVPMHEMLRALQTFKSWRWNDGPFTFNTREVSPEPCQQPIVYYLDRVEGKGNASFSTYKKAARMPGQTWITGCERPEYSMASNISEVAVSAETMAPADWQKAPRRQCCEILESGDKKHAMKLKLRKCQQGETIRNYLALSS